MRPTPTYYFISHRAKEWPMRSPHREKESTEFYLFGIVHLWALMSFSKLVALLTHTCADEKKKKLTQPNKNSCLFARIRMMFPKETSEEKKNRKTFHSDRTPQITFHFHDVFLLPFLSTWFIHPLHCMQWWAFFALIHREKIEFPFCTLGYAKIQLIWV